jgi:hypothetical protein
LRRIPKLAKRPQKKFVPWKSLRVINISERFAAERQKMVALKEPESLAQPDPDVLRMTGDLDRLRRERQAVQQQLDEMNERHRANRARLEQRMRHLRHRRTFSNA